MAESNGRRHRYLLFELTQRCQNRCLFCYNVWKEKADYPSDELGTREAIALLEKVVPEAGCEYVGLTGGEPLLKEGLLEIAAALARLKVTTILISNGKLLTDETVRKCLDRGIGFFEVSLHSDRRQIHDELAGREGSFEEALDAILAIKRHGGQVNTVFVATKSNIGRFKEFVELNALLKVDWILFNRVACGGACVADWRSLAPSPDELRRAFATGAPVAQKYRIGLSAGVQIQPCLVDLSQYPYVRSSFCPLNGELDGNSYFVIDPAGNLRMCNRSAAILGNLAAEPFPELVARREVAEFCAAVPDFCAGCKLARVCAGGCKADALSCFGTLSRPDPYLEMWAPEARKIT